MYVGIDLYYKRVFGQVQQSARDRNVDFLIAITFGVLAMIAYTADSGLALPFSSLGLVFALGLGVEWARLTLRAPGPYARYYLFLALSIAAISLLPALTPGAWWEAVGFHQPVVAILAVIGLFGMLAGLISHFYLLRALRANREAANGSAL
jgi:hypothetical protein